MKHIRKFWLFSTLFLIFVIVPIVAALTGINLTWTAPSPVGGSGVIQGYYLFRCSGTCVAGTGTWTSVGGLLPATPTSYTDLAAGLTGNTTYSYGVVTVDSNGSQSAYSNVATVLYPGNPNAPTGCNATVAP